MSRRRCFKKEKIYTLKDLGYNDADVELYKKYGIYEIDREDYLYSKSIMKRWNSTSTSSLFKAFQDNTQLVYFPKVTLPDNINMFYAFYNCKNLKTFPGNSLNLRKIKVNSSHIFYNTSLVAIDLSNLAYYTESSNNYVTSLLNGCANLVYCKLPAINASYINNCLYNCNSLEKLELTGLLTVSYTAENFISGGLFKELDLSLFEFKRKFYIRNFISNCPNLEKLTFNVGKSYFVYNTITKCPNLKYMYLFSDSPYYYDQDFSDLTAWGTGSEENRQSVLKTLSLWNKEGETNITITLSSTTMNLLTEEEIAELTANNITLASA